jgi:hypothetical protein
LIPTSGNATSGAKKPSGCDLIRSHRRIRVTLCS